MKLLETEGTNRTRVSPPEALLKGLLGERAMGCWEAELELELELNGLGKSEPHGERRDGGDNSQCGVNSTFLTIQTIAALRCILIRKRFES